MLNIWQVYFDDESRKNCYNWTFRYDNSDHLTEFFENSVIADLIEEGNHLPYRNKESGYFGVWSHDIFKELVFKHNLDGKSLKFSQENLIEAAKHYNCDGYGFQGRRRNPNIIIQAERYHKGFLEIMDACLPDGYEIPKKLEPIILFNHFMLRPHIYEEYYYELLKPVMASLKEIPEAYNDSGYGKLNRVPDGKYKERFERAFGRPYYPFHPFICERLPSLFMMKHKINFKHIF